MTANARHPWRDRLVWWLTAPVYDRLVRGTAPGRDWAVDALELADTDRVFLPGCGTGTDLAHLPPVGSVTAVDRSAAMVRRCRRRGDAHGRQLSARVGDARATACQAGSHDAALVHFVCSVADDPPGVLAEAVRVLSPTGRLSIVDEPLPAADGASDDVLARLVTDAGLTIDRRASFPAGYDAIVASRD